MDGEAPELVQASALRSEYTTRKNDVLADVTLSDVGKQQALEELHGEFEPRLDQLRQALDERTAVTARADERAVFAYTPNGPDGAISYRDALDRAENVAEPHQLQSLLQRADRTGDEHLARAVMVTALTRAVENPLGELGGDAWYDVVEMYAEGHPSEVEAINRFIDGKRSRRRGVEDRIARSLMFRLPAPKVGAR